MARSWTSPILALWLPPDTGSVWHRWIRRQSLIGARRCTDDEHPNRGGARGIACPGAGTPTSDPARRGRSRTCHRRDLGCSRGSADGLRFVPVGHRRHPGHASRLHAPRGPRDHRRLPLHAGQPAPGPELVHRLQPVRPRKHRGSPRGTLPRATVAGGNGRTGQRGRERLDVLRGGSPSQHGPGRTRAGPAAQLLGPWSRERTGCPKGTGVPLPAGSLVIMQVHYNLLVGDKPVKNTLVLHTVPISTPLQPLHLDLMLAPPNIPCPTGVTGPLCNRAASLANLGQRFGQTGGRRGERHRSALRGQSVRSARR